METENNNLHMFQKTLDDDADMQSNFIYAEVESSDSETEACKIVLPKRPKNKHSDTRHELLFQLLHQNKIISKTQKKLYKLQAEIDTKEVSMRYIKLDLNNTQVKFEETKTKLHTCKKELVQARIENWGVRLFSVLYILYSLYHLIM